jgi:hypothetical protein
LVQYDVKLFVIILYCWYVSYHGLSSFSSLLITHILTEPKSRDKSQDGINGMNGSIRRAPSDRAMAVSASAAKAAAATAPQAKKALSNGTTPSTVTSTVAVTTAALPPTGNALVSITSLPLPPVTARGAAPWTVPILQTDFTPARGNALQASVATIMRLPLERVPNFITVLSISSFCGIN